MMTFATIVACGSSKSQSGADAGPSCATVNTKLGPVLGSLEGDNNTVCAYQGIPFAAPPVGPLRWKPPQAAPPWTTPRESQTPQACPQGAAAGIGVPSTNEDCLYLNVSVPTPAPSAKMPVLVFFYGGAFEFGATSVPLYDGTNLATETGAIVITVNYRLGAFGFLSRPALRTEDAAHPSSGNYGIEDQIAALQWVQANAATFGGDPSNVTIFGESAGAVSTLLHVLSPKSAGLFAKAIVESAAALYGTTMALPEATADDEGAKVATALGCTDTQTELDCLRGKAVSDVLAAAPSRFLGLTGETTGVDWFPVVDGFVVPDDPLKLFADGAFTKVPVVIGNMANEGTFFISAIATPPTDDASYTTLEEVQYPGHGAAIVAQYPASAFGGSYVAAASEALGDGSFICPTRRIVRGLVTAGVPTYRYDFVHAITFVEPNLGAFHGSDLPFVFGNPLDGFHLQENELPLSKTVMDYWGAMATSGDPNGGGRVTWPKYDLASETQLVLDLTQSTESAFKKTQCDFWDAL